MKSPGFTLIELMIVVGIIGILSALAVPNFLRYQAKAKQAEARLSLAAIYMSNKGFYSEYSTYTSDLRFLGWTPEGKTYYRTGFISLFPAASIPGIATFTGAYNTVGLVTGSPCAPLEVIISTATVATETFNAAACGTVRSGAGMDIWSITQFKALTNAQSGI